MKKQLRNMMLAGATLLAGNAWAAGTVTNVVDGVNLKLNWETATPWGISQGRYGTAVPGEDAVYVMNNTDKELVKFTKDGYSTFMSGIADTPFGVTSDQAGNIIYNVGGGLKKGSTDYFILPAGKSSIDDVKKLQLTLPNEMDSARVDQLGRVLGNVLSEDGGWLVSALNSANAVTSYKIANGAEVESMASVETAQALNTFFVAQPWGTTLEEQESAGDPSSAVYYFGGNVSTFWGPNEDFDGWEKIARQNHRSATGFDFFVLGDETYYVYGFRGDGRAATWCSGDFAIVRASDNAIVATYIPELDTPSGAATGSIICHVNADGKSVTIHRWSSISGAASLTFTVGSDEPAAPALYAVGGWNGWDPSSPDQFEYADGKYTLTIGSTDVPVSEFKMSTTKSDSSSDWSGFEAGVICVANDAKIEENNVPYDLYVGGNSNITFGWSSQWTVTVDLTANTISAVAATEKPTVVGGDPLYVVGDNGTAWDPANPGEFTYSSATGLYTYELASPTYGFKISTAKGSWDAFNGGAYHIDGSLAFDTETPLLEGAPANGANITLASVADCTLIVDLTKMTIKAIKSGSITVPDNLYVVGQLAVGEWDPTKVVALTKDGYTFTGDVEMAGGWFSFLTVAGSWDGGQRYGAATNGAEVYTNTAVPFQAGDNAFNIQSFTEYPVTVHFVVDFASSTVTIAQVSGVESIAAETTTAAEYFNLQGIRVANPVAGQLYIVKQGNKVSKVLAK